LEPLHRTVEIISRTEVVPVFIGHAPAGKLYWDFVSLW